MKLSVACNFDDQLIDAMKGYPVYEVYGKMTSDIVGGGRPSFTLQPIDESRLAGYVKLAHSAGIEFNYLLNAACLDNVEYTRSGQKRIRKLLDFLGDAGVDSVTVNHPLLLKTIKKNYPFKTRIGVFATVNSARRARQWEDDGADCICLDDMVCNRDFPLLKSIRRAVSIDLQLLVNNSCFYACHMANTHMNMAAHASQTGHSTGGFYIDYCMMRCTLEKITNPVNFIRASWIRPEDIAHYENAGYDNFKIVERTSSVETLIQRVGAYTEKKYAGNLLDLIHSRSRKKGGAGKYLSILKYFWRPWTLNPFRLRGLKRVSELHADMGRVTIKNESLNGFITPFLTESCRDKDCEKCRYCHAIAEKHVAIDGGYRAEVSKVYERFLEKMETSKLWF